MKPSQIDKLIGEYTTKYIPSNVARAANIDLAAQLIDGYILQRVVKLRLVIVI